MGTSTVSNKKRSKAAKSALAVALALALALSGTLAYLTSQTAVNTIRTTSNPGARLHDDFAWTADNKNKDVYVENFGDKYVLARVKLAEYLERDLDAGTGGTPVTTGAGIDKDNPETWPAYVLGDTSTGGVRDHFALDLGGQTTYMPTFNKNMNSNEPDVNGSYKDEDGNVINYSNYKAYSIGEELTAEETLNGPTAEGTPGGEATHAAKKTLGAKVISMTEWETTYNSQPGPYWVYDDDAANGKWFYWAQPIAPGSTTGLLVDNVRLVSGDDDDWYYQLAAIGDFVTPEELTEDTATSTYYLNDGVDDGGATKKQISEKAYNLLDKARGMAADIGDLAVLTPGSTATAGLDLDGNDATEETPVYLLDKKTLTKGELGESGCQCEGTYGLVMVKDAIPGATQFNPGNSQPVWENSTVQTWCNNTYLNGTITGSIKDLIPEVTLYTSKDGTFENYAATKDRVFLLSETDMFGTLGGKACSTELAFYTSGKRLITAANESILSQSSWYWLRSAYSSGAAAFITDAGDFSCSMQTGAAGTVRPAFWVYLGA